MAAERYLFKKLPPARRRKLLAYIDSPSYEGWMAIRDMPVAIGQTLSAMVNILDVNGTEIYPSAILIARASKLAERRDADLEAMEM